MHHTKVTTWTKFESKDNIQALTQIYQKQLRDKIKNNLLNTGRSPLVANIDSFTIKGRVHNGDKEDALLSRHTGGEKDSHCQRLQNTHPPSPSPDTANKMRDSAEVERIDTSVDTAEGKEQEGRKGVRQRQSERDRECVCVCVCV